MAQQNTNGKRKSTIKKVVKYFKMAKRMTRVALIASSFLLIIFAIITYKTYRASFGISLLATGAICIFIATQQLICFT